MSFKYLFNLSVLGFYSMWFISSASSKICSFVSLFISTRVSFASLTTFNHIFSHDACDIDACKFNNIWIPSSLSKLMILGTPCYHIFDFIIPKACSTGTIYE